MQNYSLTLIRSLPTPFPRATSQRESSLSLAPHNSRFQLRFLLLRPFFSLPFLLRLHLGAVDGEKLPLLGADPPEAPQDLWPAFHVHPGPRRGQLGQPGGCSRVRGVQVEVRLAAEAADAPLLGRFQLDDGLERYAALTLQVVPETEDPVAVPFVEEGCRLNDRGI